MTLLTDLAAWFDDVKAEFILNFIDKNRWRMLLTGLGNTPVSYTHLDVYKRQILKSSKHTWATGTRQSKGARGKC